MRSTGQMRIQHFAKGIIMAPALFSNKSMQACCDPHGTLTSVDSILIQFKMLYSSHKGQFYSNWLINGRETENNKNKQ